jgi:putative membrane protein
VDVDVVVALAVAGVITVGHGHGDDQDHDDDHHASARLGARLDRGKACSFNAASDVAALVAGLRAAASHRRNLAFGRNLLAMHTLLQIVILAATVLAIARFLPDVQIKGFGTAVIVSVVFSVLNFLLGWLIHVVLFVPALLTLGLLFLFIPFIVNTAMLWLTDKLVAAFEIKTLRALLTSAAVITVVNWLFHAVIHSQRLPGWR